MSILNGAWVAAQTWALEAGAYRSLMAAVQAGGLQAAPASRATSRSSGAVAVVPVRGFIAPKGSPLLSFFGGTGVDEVVAGVRRAVDDPGIRAVVMAFDSPGGTVDGVTEGAAALRALRGRKPIIAVADTLMASAAFWLGAQADEVVASPSALVGSVGVFAGHVDESRALDAAGLVVTLIHYGEAKVDGASVAPLSDRARASIQRRVTQAGQQFEADVAAGRRVSVATVQRSYGAGAPLTAKDAKAAGVVDRVASFDSVLAGAGAGRAARLTAELERDVFRLAAGFPVKETEGYARRRTEELQAYFDRMGR